MKKKRVSPNSRNAGMKPGQTNKGSFKKGDKRRWNHGQRNKAAVALSGSIRKILVSIGDEQLTVKMDDGTKHTKLKKEWLGQKLWAMALKGEMSAVRELLERIQPVKETGNDADIDEQLKRIADAMMK